MRAPAVWRSPQAHKGTEAKQYIGAELAKKTAQRLSSGLDPMRTGSDLQLEKPDTDSRGYRLAEGRIIETEQRSNAAH